VALLATLALLVLGSSAAAAHDRLVSTSPDDGATVATTPAQVSLTFSDDVVPVGTKIVVSGPDGDVQQGRPRVDGATVTQSLAPGSSGGSYTVTWRATSKDGHPVSGTFRFTASAAGATVPSRTAVTSDPPTSTTPSAAASATSSTADPAAAPSSSTGEADQTGTSWGLWLVLAVLVLAGAGAAAVRLRRGHAHRGQG
jgi:methionine-rich copper-binding protein CopC